MTKQYTSKDYFPEWYQQVDVAASGSVVQNRLLAIDELVEDEDVELWLSISRLALNLKVENQENVLKFVDKFRNHDVNFPISKNENLLNVLSKISLCFLFEKENLFSKTISRVIINASFFSREYTEIPYLDYAEQNLLKPVDDISFDASGIKDALLEKQTELEDDEDEEEIFSHEDCLNITKAVNYLVEENELLKNETNVLWWLFGQYSNVYNSYFNEVGSSKMILASAKELTDLTKSQPIVSAKHILHKVLLLANNQKVTKSINLSTVIANSDTKVVEQLLACGNLNDLTPILLAIKLCTDLGEDSLWNAAFKKINNAFDAKKSFSQHEIAYQLYSEIIFIRSLKQFNYERN